MKKTQLKIPTLPTFQVSPYNRIKFTTIYILTRIENPLLPENPHTLFRWLIPERGGLIPLSYSESRENTLKPFRLVTGA